MRTLRRADDHGGSDHVRSSQRSDAAAEEATGLTSMVVTHDLDLMYKVADQVVFLFEGKVIFSDRRRICINRIIRISGSFLRWTG